MIFKIMHNLICINFDDFFALNSFSITRGHEYKLVKPICNNNARQFSFACRRIEIWNDLPADVVSCDTVNAFKMRINKINFNKYLKHEQAY